jgi:TonB-dependent starch-binding outer membrane protein SusC
MQNALCNRSVFVFILGKDTSRFLTKTMRVMQLTAILLTICCLSVTARTVSQSVTYSGKDVRLETVFNVIKKQTGYFVVFEDELASKGKLVNVDVKDMPLTEFLDEILKEQPFTYSLKKTTITIARKVAADDLSHRLIIPSLTAPPVTGIVRGPDGQPLAGVNIIVKGTKRGTVSGADGRFMIDAKDGEVLLLSSIGYVPRQLTVDGNALVNAIVMAIAESKLDEVQIKAYGNTSQRLSTSNISTIKAKDIEKQPVTNPLLALQGRVPGLIIQQSTGFANSGVSVKIQGQNSLTNGSDPLYVVDGVPISSRLPGNGAFILGPSGPGYPNNAVGQGNGSPLSFLNPADIESIDILKDADATSIYGSRAAAGAILITTKKGKAGKTTTDLNIQQGFGQVARRVDLMNTSQYLEMRKEAFANDGLPIPDASTSPLNSNVDLTFWDQQRYTDWQKELIGGTAKYTNITGAVSGGNENTQFIIGSGFNRQTVVFPGDLSNVKGSVHFNINNSSPNKKFNILLSGNYMVDNNRLVARDLTGTAMTLAPNAPKLYNNDGSLNWEPLPAGGSSSWEHPLSYLGQTVKIKTSNLISNATLSYAVLPSLQIKSSFGYNNMQIDELQRRPLTIWLPEDRQFQRRETNQRTTNVNSWIIEPQVNFKHTMFSGSLEALIGATLQTTNSRFFIADAFGFTSDLLMEDLASAPLKSIYSGSAEYVYNAGFFNLNYNFQSKYIISIAGRRDGSSRFGSENLFHNFGSVAGAWIFSNERFITNVLPFVSFGKLKASYGTTGTDQIGDYRFLDLNSYVYSELPYQGSTGLAPYNIPNPYLQWEETRKLSIGADLGFAADRILLNVVYYQNRSSNQLLSYDLPVATGFPEILLNFDALVQNSGWEISLNTTNVKSGIFSWTSNFNLTLNRNKLLDFPDLANSSYATQYVVGQPSDIRKVYPYVGVDEETGLYMVSDKNGKPTTTPVGSFQPNTDATIIINNIPKFFGGLQNSMSYKGFALDFLFQFVKQLADNPNMFGIGTQPGQFYGTSNLGNQPTGILDRWQKPGDHGRVQRYSTNFSVGNTYNNATSSDVTYTDGSYVRLKNVSVSWQLPDRIKKDAHVQNARIFVQGQNLLTFTKYKGLDPETTGSISLPPLRVVTFGVQVTL